MTTQSFKIESNKNTIIVVILSILLFISLSGGAYAFFWKMPEAISNAQINGHDQAVAQLTSNRISSDQFEEAIAFLKSKKYSQSDPWGAAAAAKLDLEIELKCKSGVSRIILKGNGVTKLYYALVFLVDNKMIYVAPFNGIPFERVELKTGLWTANNYDKPDYDDTITDIGVPVW